MSLLKKARALQGHHDTQGRRFTKDEQELVLGWLRGEFSLQRIARVMRMKNNASAYPFALRCIQQMFVDGVLTAKRSKK